MGTRPWIIIAGTIGFLSVAGGAFGAHALAEHVTPARLETFDTGTRYAQVHAVALLVAALLRRDHPDSTALTVSCAAFTVGMLIFTGSLWLLVLTDTGWLGAITPLGGVSLLVGWASLVIAAARSVDR